jgi:FlaA1/EpsC-like NDP-sugar epimerase
MLELPINGSTLAGWLQRRLVAAGLASLAPRELQRFFMAHRLAFIRLWQTLVIGSSLVAAYLLRFDLVIPDTENQRLRYSLAIALVAKTAIFYLFGIERGWWRFAGIADLARIAVANAVGSLVFTVATRILIGPQFPRSVYVIDFLLCFVVSAGARFSIRLYNEVVVREASSSKDLSKGLLIYGAGAAGLNLVREIRSNPHLKYRIVGFLDDDAHKRNTSLLGVPVLGCGRDAARIVDRYRIQSTSVDEIVIAMPSASGRQISEALANCRATGVACKTIPSVGEMLAGKVRLSQIREVSVEDLLGRAPVHLEHDRIRDSVAGLSVMVTGAAGSIGSELCRQLVRFQPKCLVALDQAESDLFKLEMELVGSSGSVEICPVMGDVRNYERIEEVIRQYGINSIYHAAAYKHVPMMENNLVEAVNNNVIGVYNVVQAASHNGVRSFVMISSDKAVNPTNVMGLTKRVAELVVSSRPIFHHISATRFVSVRFGNVLGSNGSVVPIFRAQIASGGPVTITHPDMRRYFMTIPEAVQLVLQASTMGKGSEVFVLDMGEPVRILDLARNMIRLSGHEPDVDIPIRFVGLRPGEKLFEELSTASDQVRPTCHEKIMIFCGPNLQYVAMQHWITELQELLAQRNDMGVLMHMMQIVPEYQPSGKWSTLLGEGRMKERAAISAQAGWGSAQRSHRESPIASPARSAGTLQLTDNLEV